MNRENIMDEVAKRLDEYLLSQNYFAKYCKNCGKRFYTLVLSNETCGSYRCEGSRYRFLNESLSENFLSLVELSKLLKVKWDNQGFKVVKPISILHRYEDNLKNPKKLGNTLFTVAGIQILDDVIFGERYNLEQTKYFVAQPSIRMKYMPLVGKIDGISTSFINVCTEELNPDIKSFVHQIDVWLKLLFSLKINPYRLNLKVKKGVSRWGRKEFNGVYVKFNYGGLELGDASFLLERYKTLGKALQLIDTGFGLERIAWVINKTPSYFDSIGPFIESFYGKKVLIDHIRTLTLIMGYGITSSRSLHGYRVKQLIKNLLKTNGLLSNYQHLIPYYHNFWSKFITLPLSPFEIKKRFQQEINREINLRIKEGIKLKREIDLSIPPQEFIGNLIKGRYGKKIKITSIKNLLNELYEVH